MKKRKINKIKNRAVASIVAAFTAVSVLLGGSFDSPAQLLEDGLSPAAYAADTLVSELPDTDDGSDDGVIPGDEKKKSFRARMRERVMALPWLVRAVVGVPLWCVGWLLIGAVTILWEPLLSPAASGLLNALCVAGVVLAALLLTVKAAFPDMPLKKILSKRNISTAFIGALIFGIVGAFMQIFMPEYERLRDIAEGFIILMILTLTAVPLLKKEAARRKAAAKIARATVPHRRDERKYILELADSAG